MRIDRPIAAAIILFATLLLVFFLAAPEYKIFKRLRADLGEKRAQYNAEFDYFAEITKKYYELENRKDDLKKIDDALPEDPNLGKIIYYFQKTAADSGMLIKDLFLSSAGAGLANGEGENAGKVNDLIFSMDVMGNYASLGKFLTSLEKSDRIFEVASISFQAGESAQFSQYPPPQSQFQIQQIYSFNLQVKTHSY